VGVAFPANHLATQAENNAFALN